MREVELPPLPEPDNAMMQWKNERGRQITHGFGPAKMREYARQAVLQERERCAAICDRMRSVSAVSYETGSACAAAIRSQT